MWNRRSSQILLGTVPVLLSLASGGCHPHSHEVRQSALLPSATALPPPTMDGDADLYLGATVPTTAGSLDVERDEPKDFWVPRLQLDGAVGMHFTDRYAVRAWVRYGAPGGAMERGPGELPRPDEGVFGVGLGHQVRFGDPEDRTTMDLIADVGFLSVPASTRWRCIDFGWCGDDAGEGQARSNVVQLALQVLGRWDATREMEFLFGLSIQNHPTANALDTNWDPSPRIDFGSPYVVPILGLEMKATPGLRVIPTVQWPVGSGPVLYAPIFGLAVRAVLHPQ